MINSSSTRRINKFVIANFQYDNTKKTRKDYEIGDNSNHYLSESCLMSNEKIKEISNVKLLLNLID